MALHVWDKSTGEELTIWPKSPSFIEHASGTIYTWPFGTICHASQYPLIGVKTANHLTDYVNCIQLNVDTNCVSWQSPVIHCPITLPVCHVMSSWQWNVLEVSICALSRYDFSRLFWNVRISNSLECSRISQNVPNCSLSLYSWCNCQLWWCYCWCVWGNYRLSLLHDAIGVECGGFDKILQHHPTFYSF